MPSRQQVYEVLEGEIAYQDAMTASPERPDMVANLSAGDTILAMEQCLEQARTAWYHDHGPDYEATANFIRKVTALGVRFMERTSAPPRGTFG